MVWPGTAAVAVLAVLTMVSAGVSTGTVRLHPALEPPGGQLLPGSVEAATVARLLPPVSGLSTVTVQVMTAESPGFSGPVQVMTGLV